MDQPRTSAAGEGAVFASPDGTHYMALTCYLNGSLAREAVRDQYGMNWDQFTSALRATPPGNNDALMLPYFAPEIVPKVPATNVVRQNLDPTDAPANVRAVIEAQALSSRIHARWMGVEISSLYVTGGASANAEILRVFANVHNCPVPPLRDDQFSGPRRSLARCPRSHQSSADHAPSWAGSRRAIRAASCRIDHRTRSRELVAAYDELIGQYAALEQAHT